MAKKKQRNTSASTTQARVSAQAERQQRLNAERTTSTTTTRSSQRTRRSVVRRNTAWWWVGGIVLACVVVVIAFVVIANNQKPSGVVSTTTSSSILQAVTTVSPSVSRTVGTGGLQSKIVTPITKQPALNGPNGKPQFFYYGAEWCPYCAATRWSVVVALSRFGTFTKLPETLSSSSDVYPNTATFSFDGSAYTSSFIDFVPLEAQDRTHNTLQTPTAAEQQLLKTFNVSSYPFIDIANKYRINSSYDPSVLAGLSQAQIASKLSNPNDTVTQNIVGEANYLTAAICATTQNQPANVCSAEPIPTIMQSLTLDQHNSLPINNQADIMQNQLVFVDRRRV